jgi:hypothetical protein
MTNIYTGNADIVYPLTVQERGKIYITKDDPRNNLIGLAQLYAKYGQGNVIVIDQFNMSQPVDTISMANYSSERMTPVYTISNNPGSTMTIPSDVIGLNPPTNLAITSSTSVLANDGTVSYTVALNFDDVIGAMSYEGIFIPQVLGYSTQSVTGLVATGGTGLISVTWVPIANASNYVLYATLSGKNYYATVPVVASANATSATGSITGLSAGSYTVTVVPYNSNGIAGQSATTPSTVTVV